MNNRLLFVILAIAKISGIMGIIAGFGHPGVLGAILLAFDGTLLVYIVVAAYRAMLAANNLPTENHPHANANGYIAD